MELKQEDLFVQGSRRDQIEGGEDTKFEYFWVDSSPFTIHTIVE